MEEKIYYYEKTLFKREDEGAEWYFLGSYAFPMTREQIGSQREAEDYAREMDESIGSSTTLEFQLGLMVRWDSLSPDRLARVVYDLEPRKWLAPDERKAVKKLIKKLGLGLNLCQRFSTLTNREETLFYGKEAVYGIKEGLEIIRDRLGGKPLKKALRGKERETAEALLDEFGLNSKGGNY